jgi:hypothetical protein
MEAPMLYDCCMGAHLKIRDLQIRFALTEAARGISHELLTAPAHAYTRSLLTGVPTLRTDLNRPLALVGYSNAARPGLYSPHAE